MLRYLIPAAAFVTVAIAAGPVRPAAPLRVVVAENVYEDIAAKLAGAGGAVVSIMSNPEQDPHLFEASPSVAREVAKADIVVMNGLDYDPWMSKLLGVSHPAERTVIVVADLLHLPPGSNPHIWYDPSAVPAYAQALTAALIARDPANEAVYRARLHAIIDALAPLTKRVDAMRKVLAGTPVTATEPVFGDMAAALGLQMRNEKFQLAVMNDTEPSASDVAAMEDDLRQHRVKLLIYNSQATNTAAKRLLRIAHDAAVPVVGVTEARPKGQDYLQWMLSELDAVQFALEPAHPPHS